MTLEPLPQTTLSTSLSRPEVHAQRIATAIESALAPSTRKAYESALARLTRWARREGFTDPTSSVCLAAYITDLEATGRSASTVGQILAAVSRHAFERGNPDPTDDPVLVQVVEGVRRRIGRQHTVERAHALTTPEVVRILAAIDQETVAGRRDACMIATFLYAGALRRSEVGALRRSDVVAGADGLRVTIRSSKGDQHSAGQVIGIARGKHTATDPVRLLTRWLAVRGKIGPDAALFPRVTRTGVPTGAGLTGHAVGRIMKERAAVAGLDAEKISGHSGRRGHVSTAVLAGSDLALVAKQTRHKALSTLMLYADELRVLEKTTSADLGL
ncbi:site-specific integrase [Gryllotalpicola daejeonensis]|uniref:Site-specific integrase n=1 Tax=Gryllotalpicola daejeonensis TaxID=993087 RepID=A0ABP7ZCQ8_9MICO